MLRPEQLVATVVSDSERRAGVGTVIATEFLGSDVLLTIDPAGDAAPITVRQHSINPPPVDAKVRIDVVGDGVVLPMSGLVDHLRAHGEHVAVLTETGQLTYRALADRVAAAATSSAASAAWSLLETRNDLTTLVHYLGALAGNHVVLPVPAGRDNTGDAGHVPARRRRRRRRSPHRAFQQRPPAA